MPPVGLEPTLCGFQERTVRLRRPATGRPTYPAPVRRRVTWLEIILAATDLVASTKLISFHTDLTTCEIVTFRYRDLHVAAGITRGARRVRLHIDPTWRWATAICQEWQ